MEELPSLALKIETYRNDKDVLKACNIALESKLHHPSGEYLLRKMLTFHAQNKALFHTIAIAYISGVPSGIITADKWNRVTIYVHPELRRRRVGEKLWESIHNLLDVKHYYAYSINIEFWQTLERAYPVLLARSDWRFGKIDWEIEAPNLSLKA